MHLHVDEAHNAQVAAEPAAKLVRPLVLAIESSCDETAAAIVDGEGNLLSDVVASQIDFHARFGGVVPEIASRKHIEAICGVCDECLDVAARRLGAPRLDLAQTLTACGVHATRRALWARSWWAWRSPRARLGRPTSRCVGREPSGRPPVREQDRRARFRSAGGGFPRVSGGNTMLVHMRDWGDYCVLGATIDDAVGEAFDKVAKALGLGYPGGPVVSAQGAKGNPKAIAFPRAMMHSGDMRFSLSGLKTAVVTYINNERAAGRPLNTPDICASFEAAVVDVQVKKAEMALRQTGAPTFCLGGGVAANPVLRAAYEKLCAKTARAPGHAPAFRLRRQRRHRSRSWRSTASAKASSTAWKPTLKPTLTWSDPDVANARPPAHPPAGPPALLPRAH